MRKKSEDQGFAIAGLGIENQFLNDFLVAQMNAVKSANGNDSFFMGAEASYRLKNLQNHVWLDAANLRLQIDI